MEPALLARRLARVEAVQAIHDLIAGFARGADAHCDPVLLRPLFTDDAVFDIGRFGRLEGGDHIVAEMHRNNARGFQWTLHYLTSPAIEVADDLRSATVFFYLWETATHPKPGAGDVACWIGGWYDAQAVPHGDGTWRFRRLQLTIRLMSPYAEGWKPVPAGFDDL
jgi:hypothetical protein